MSAVTFTPAFTICQTNNCSTVKICGNTNWGVGYAISAVVSITLEFGQLASTSPYGPTDITSAFIQNLTGTVTTNGTVNMVGAGTAFLTEVSVGDIIYIASTGEYMTVSEVTDDTHIVFTTIATAAAGVAGIRIAACIDFISTDIGLSSFTDGYYYYEVIITMSDTSVHTVYQEPFFKCNIDCCRAQMLARMADQYACNGCDSTFIQQFNYFNALYQALESAVRNCDTLSVLEILPMIQRICSVNNCNCT